MTAHKWWQTAVFYQIYPRSFADGNGDGIGDFKGATEKLDYLASLGVDAVWLSPHFPSPNWDCGYDISDYCNVAPEYGTLDDFKTFLNEAHKRNIRVILDLVLNHTSDEHAWFLESKSSRDNPKADWYVWVDTPPNNWQSCFDGEAWTYVPERGQYYYHYFMKQQPDLNWHNPEVKKAMWDAARFWLDMGVDGYRLDAIGTIFEDPQLTPHNVPMNLAELRRFSELANTPKEKKLKDKYWYEMFKHQYGKPGVHELMKELRAILEEYEGDRMLVGEDDDIAYMGNGRDELQLIFNFPLMRTDQITPAHIRKNQKDRLAALEKLPVETGWPCNTLGNHDCSRIHTRYGDKIHDAELARLNAALVLTLKGTAFLYNGEEIGMTDFMLSDISHVKDTMGSWYYHTIVTEMGVHPEEAMLRTAEMTRDKNRTPMQWSNSPNAGFSPSGVNTWLPVNPNYKDGINVYDQDKNPSSLLHYYKHLLRVRKGSPALQHGEYLPLHNTSREYFAFLRRSENQTVLVVLNYSDKVFELDFSRTKEIKDSNLRILFTSAERRGGSFAPRFKVGAFEVFIAETERG
ncbi:MAG TPA: alpha-glucosidase [Anaerolineales bacterium]|nr:alpha-glucosidase [Anaerolineales bacterium]HMX73008.1 alpha-glucosidase [Anaerolineales bacterium]HMZ42744.1 alpha-glucosidase [Anaerolineales bacterium]HNA54197.1 alpha-glucosidase [Anaerolineales bacterium]HNB85122.1 alpha-glucosidase [Anaerolineales bacterium]